MLKFCSLYSGSSGNCLFIESEHSKILVDAGRSAKKISEALSQINVSLEQIDAILISHEHIDHIRGLNVIMKKYNIPIYSNLKTWSKLPQDSIKSSNIQMLFDNEKAFKINDLEILPFSIPHDAIDPCGFNIYNNNTKISIATDLGYIDERILKHLETSSFVMLESNYDPEILKCCSYPYNLKQRILGPSRTSF